MITIKYDNGYEGTYDETLKPGDMITAYRKGYHEFIKFEERGTEIVPLVHYKQIYNDNGKPCKSKTIYQCDGAYCRRAIDDINKQIEKKTQELTALKEILKKT